MRYIFYSILFLATLLSCKNTTSTAPVQEAESVPAESKQEHCFIYSEVSGLERRSDYNSTNKVQKLDLDYQLLSIKIRYISDQAYMARAYMAMDNGNASLYWQPLKINFYYDMSFEDAEKDIHLLIKDNNTAEGYLLFPAFTEQYASYFVYHFEKKAFHYMGQYEATDFKKGAFSFNAQAKTFYRSSDKSSRLSKIEVVDSVDFDLVAADLKLLEENAANEHRPKHVSTSNEWLGTYNGSFLRLKEESADPRAWGTINLTIAKESVKFHLDTYNEDVVKELEVVFADARKIRFVARDNNKQVLTLLLDKNKYRLSGSLIEQIVGVRETYELEKK